MKLVNTISIELENGDLILGVTGKQSHRAFFVKTSDGVFEYNEMDMKEIYGYIPIDTSSVGIKCQIEN